MRRLWLCLAASLVAPSSPPFALDNGRYVAQGVTSPGRRLAPVHAC